MLMYCLYFCELLKANRKNKRLKSSKKSELEKFLSGHDNFIYSVLCSDIFFEIEPESNVSENKISVKKISANKRKAKNA